MKPLVHTNQLTLQFPIRTHRIVLCALTNAGTVIAQRLLILCGTTWFPGGAPLTGLEACLEELERCECVRRLGNSGLWQVISAADRKMKGPPFPLDHPLFGGF